MPAKKISRKHFKFGLEVELFTLDQDGYVVNEADNLIKAVQETHPEINIRKECAKHMVEIGTNPYLEIPNLMESFITDLEAVLFRAKQLGLVLYPYGTYPGVLTPEFNPDKSYKVKQEIFGSQRFMIAGRCAGLHCHYTLPWGVFDNVKKIIKELVHSKHKQSLVNIHNLFIAMDPALTTFTQSSPFYQGARLGKDARMIVYRGGKTLDYPQGLYAKHQHFGALQPYKMTSTDLLNIITFRFDTWTALIKKLGVKAHSVGKHGSRLDTTWNPVKLNAHGTMEQRGMDMTLPSVVVAVALIIKYCSYLIQEDFVQVVSSEIGIREPFKKDGNVIYIPPHTHVRFELQKKAAYQGLEDDTVHEYCKGLLKLAKIAMPESRHIFLEPLEAMIKECETLSDKIIKKAKDEGITEEKIANGKAAKFALKLSEQLFQDVVMTKQSLHNLPGD